MSPKSMRDAVVDCLDELSRDAKAGRLPKVGSPDHLKTNTALRVFTVDQYVRLTADVFAGVLSDEGISPDAMVKARELAASNPAERQLILGIGRYVAACREAKKYQLAMAC